MYSQIGQDDWVLSLFNKDYKGFFMDIGCNGPKIINNTYLLEQFGWNGIALDIVDFSELWKERKSLFIQADVSKYDFRQLCLPDVVDYLSLDVDTLGMNYFVLKRLILANFTFKAVTIEHNLYAGSKYNDMEREPQRRLLLAKGYTLAHPDMANGQNIFEDWWINEKYINV